jgi:hypothetical protein
VEAEEPRSALLLFGIYEETFSDKVSFLPPFIELKADIDEIKQ